MDSISTKILLIIPYLTDLRETPDVGNTSGEESDLQDVYPGVILYLNQ